MKVADKIVEVKGGHIVRSTNSKDQRRKVCAAKGPRDHRFRLSARTVIKFYDVQDRLGYDRPSKAVDWLIKNARASIDELTEASEEHMKKHMPATEESVSDPFSVGCLRNSSFLPPSLDSDAIANNQVFFSLLRLRITASRSKRSKIRPFSRIRQILAIGLSHRRM